MPQEAATPLSSEHPRPLEPRRVVPHMLGVAAREIGDPITALVLVEADDGPQRHVLPGRYSTDVKKVPSGRTYPWAMRGVLNAAPGVPLRSRRMSPPVACVRFASR